MIFRRGTLYLSAFYTWVRTPHRFPLWQLDGLLDLFTKWRDKPTHFAVVGKMVDLDTVEWQGVCGTML